MQLRPRTVSYRGNAAGFSLVEMMVTMLIAMIITVITVSVTASALSANTRSIQMIQLSQEMRSIIQMISRDIRRAGYEDDALARYLTTQGIASGVTLGTLDANNAANCLQIQYEDLNGAAINVVYRLRVVSSVGRVAANFSTTATCDTSILGTGWVDISDPLSTNVDTLEFVMSEQLTDVVNNSDTGNMIQVGVQQVSIVVGASLRDSDAVARTIVNEVRLRNATLTI